MFSYLRNPFCMLDLKYNRDLDLKEAEEYVNVHKRQVDEAMLKVSQAKEALVEAASGLEVRVQGAKIICGGVTVEDVLKFSTGLENATTSLQYKLDCLKNSELHFQAVAKAVKTEAYKNAVMYFQNETEYNAKCVVEEEQNKIEADKILGTLDKEIEAQIGSSVFFNRLVRHEDTFSAGELVGCINGVFSNGRNCAQQWYYRVVVLRVLENGYYLIAADRSVPRDIRVVYGSALAKLERIERDDKRARLE